MIQTLDGPGGVPTGDEHWDDLSEFVQLGNTEIWEFENPGEIMHPMHIHLVAFQVLDRTLLSDGTPLALAEHELNTWKDTVAVPAGTRVRVIARYQDYLGRFPYHCHILDHEDHEMMRQFVMVNDPANCDLDGYCEAGEDGFGCADCAQVSGAACGNGLCEIGDGEDCTTCPADCNGEQDGGGDDFCCGNGGTNPIGCGTSDSDSRCIDTGADRFCRVAPRVDATCGDLLCEGQESTGNCPQDCSVPFCEPTESINEVSCADVLDNDCDGFVDVADSDCQLPDNDGDGVPDETDDDDDNDGVLDIQDSEPLDPDVCQDLDGDTCDDCAIGTDDFGPLPDNDPANDGPDADEDGICDPGEEYIFRDSFEDPPNP